MGKFSVLLFCLIFIPLSAVFSQTPTPAKTLEYINKLLLGKCKVEFSHGKLIADYFDDKGKLIREDKVDPRELDYAEIDYEMKDKNFFIPCKYKAADCVYRKMMVSGN